MILIARKGWGNPVATSSEPYIHTQTHTDIHIPTYIHIHKHTCIHRDAEHKYKHTETYRHREKLICTQINMHTNTHMPIQMHKCTHMQTKETHVPLHDCTRREKHMAYAHWCTHRTCIQIDMFTHIFTDEYAWTHTLRTCVNQNTHSLKTQMNQRPRNLLSSSPTISGSHCLPF